MIKHTTRGFTLVETLIGTAVLIGGASAFLAALNGTMVQTEYLSQYQVALDAAQGQLEALAATPFDILATGGTFTGARANGQPCEFEDRNCNGVLDGSEDLNRNGVLDTPLPGGKLDIQIKNPDGTPPTAGSTLLTLHVAACWQFRGRAIGGDRDCDGQRNGTDDATAQGFINSPVMVSTVVARRN